MSEATALPGTTAHLQVDWSGAVPATNVPVLIFMAAPVIAATLIPCLLVAAEGRTARVQVLVRPEILVPVGTPVDLSVSGHGIARGEVVEAPETT